jgi:hypothetical protein
MRALPAELQHAEGLQAVDLFVHVQVRGRPRCRLGGNNLE